MISKYIEQLNVLENSLREEFKKVDDVVMFNSLKVMNAFNSNKLSEYHFNSTTGYGYNDVGRDVIEQIFSNIFKSEDALVRSQLISGTHALTVALFGVLRPNDKMLCITGTPYDTLHEVIGIKENESSLKSFGVIYDQVELINDDFNYDEISKKLEKDKIKLIYIQRSKGYSKRKSIGIDKVEKVIKKIREIDANVIVMIDNCYCEFVTTKEPIEVGANVCVGSLIKNLGGGISSSGAYIVGDKNLISLISQRLTVPGEGKEIGPSLNMNKMFLQGLFNAPRVVGSAVKTAILTSLAMSQRGYCVEPKCNDERVDIVQNIVFNNPEDLIKYCQGIQSGSPVDSNVLPYPSDMPGYDDKIIMASGSFTQGSSIEISCDGPLRPPYIAYQQGAFTYEYGKISVAKAIEKLEENK